MTLLKDAMDSIFSTTHSWLGSRLSTAQLDHSAFDTKLRPCDLSQCRATCCHDGVQLSREDAELLESAKSRYSTQLQSYGIETKGKVTEKSSRKSGWKTKALQTTKEFLADDFPAHFPTTRCVFLDSRHRCGLQRLALELGKHPWHFKPHTCWIHPLLLQKRGSHYSLTLVSEQNDPQQSKGYPGYASCTHCGREDQGGIPAQQALQQELLALGELAQRDFIAELNAPQVDWYD